jgi:hypothetical protein
MCVQEFALEQAALGPAVENQAGGEFLTGESVDLNAHGDAGEAQTFFRHDGPHTSLITDQRRVLFVAEDARLVPHNPHHPPTPYIYKTHTENSLDIKNLN